MHEKSELFSHNHDVDVEIEYLQDSLKRVSQDLVMDLKVSNLKTL